MYYNYIHVYRRRSRFIISGSSLSLRRLNLRAPPQCLLP